jgi:hypothetical protein
LFSVDNSTSPTRVRTTRPGHTHGPMIDLTRDSPEHVMGNTTRQVVDLTLDSSLIVIDLTSESPTVINPTCDTMFEIIDLTRESNEEILVMSQDQALKKVAVHFYLVNSTTIEYAYLSKLILPCRRLVTTL